MRGWGGKAFLPNASPVRKVGGNTYFLPISVSFFSASASAVIVAWAIVTSCGVTGSTLRAKPGCTGPHICPQLSAAVTNMVITAPKVRMPKRVAHVRRDSKSGFGVYTGHIPGICPGRSGRPSHWAAAIETGFPSYHSWGVRFQAAADAPAHCAEMHRRNSAGKTGRTAVRFWEKGQGYGSPCRR